MEKIKAIAVFYIRHHAALSILVSVIILIITPILFGTTQLDAAESAVPLEMFISLIGIVLFTPVFQPEQDDAVRDLVSSKYISTRLVYFIRTVCAAILIILFTGLFVVYLQMQQCDVTVWLYLGTVANAVFLGALGMMTAALTNNTVIGYMIPLVYYALNYGVGDKLGYYYLFSMRISYFTPKLWLGVTGGLLILFSIFMHTDVWRASRER